MRETSPSRTRDLQVTAHPEQERLEFVPFDRLFEQVQEVHDAIARRAYNLFERDGYSHGRAMDHWLNAEKEMLHPVPVELTETDEALHLRAEVPGFRAEDLKLSIEPRRVAISGKREKVDEKKSRRAIYHEQFSNRICRSLELPIEIDPTRAKTTIHDGVLEIAMPKATVRKMQVASRVA